MAKDDDEAWRAIVDNYGERAELDPDSSQVEADTQPPPASYADPTPAPADEPAATGWDEEHVDADWSSDRFVPPAPPPVPTTSTDRLAAWAGIFGSPALLLICLVLGISLTSFVAYLLVAAFVGGFLYLVVQMPRGPRDPGDDGARL